MPASNRDWRVIENDREKYAAYLCSREWGVLKEAVRERAAGLCERCKFLPMDACHHLTYERKYNENLEDLQATCRPCHEFTHGKSNFDPEPNINFIHWLCLKDIEAPWLSHAWATNWLREVFDYPPLPPVFQLWLSKEFSSLGASSCINAFAELETEDGDKVEDIGSPPTDWELEFWHQLTKPQKAFWSWLSWGGPTHHPSNDRDVFAKCAEIAATLEKAK